MLSPLMRAFIIACTSAFAHPWWLPMQVIDVILAMAITTLIVVVVTRHDFPQVLTPSTTPTSHNDVLYVDQIPY